MNDLASTLEQITQREAERQVEREKARARNRAKFPLMVELIDCLTPVFGPCRVIYAQEDGQSVGKLPEGL